MIRLAPLAALLLALTACGSLRTQPPPRDPMLLSDQPAPLGRVCRVVPLPEELPPAGVLVDSARLGAALLELREADEARLRGYALLSLAYDRTGVNIRRSLIEHDLPAVVADSLQKLVFAYRQQVPGGEEWGVRLRLDLDEEVAMRVGRQEFCQPRTRAGGMMTGSGNIWERSPPGIREETVWVRVFLNPYGSVEAARIERGFISGAAETQLVNYVRMLSFEPALADGIPVSGSTVVPVVVRRR